MYGFDGIGTSASSDAEEMEYYSKQHASYTSCDQNIRSRYYEEMKVDDEFTNDEAHSKYWGDNGYVRPSGSEASSYDQPREPMRGSCFVDVGNIGMGATSDTFFGKTVANSNASNDGVRSRAPGAKIPSDQDARKEPFRGGCFVDVVNNIGMGATSDTFFGDIDKNNGEPKGTRAKKSSQPAAPRGFPSDNFFGQARGSFQTGIFEVTENPKPNNSFFGKVVDGKPPGARGVANDKSKSRFPRRQQPDIQPPPHAATNPSPFAGKTSTPNHRRSSPFVGDRIKEVNVGHVRGGSPRGGRVPSIGGDIQMELNIEFTTAFYGGEAKVRVTRLCSNCGGQGLKRKATDIKVTIPAGSKDGSMVRLSGEGDAGAHGGPAGDLFVFLRAKQDVRPETQNTNTVRETMKVEIPNDLNEEELALFNKLQSMLEQRGQQP
jgi:hypothetical protein